MTVTTPAIGYAELGSPLFFLTVVTLLIVNSDNFLPSDFDAVFKSAGLDTLSYAPTSASVPASQWPTLGSMIDSGKRLVTFLDANADFTSVPYLIDGESSILRSHFSSSYNTNLLAQNSLMSGKLPLM